MNVLKLKIKKSTYWSIETDESGNFNDFSIFISTDANTRFHFKYHDVIDIRHSNVFIQDESGQFFSLEYMINLFIDAKDKGGIRNFELPCRQHGLLSFGNGYNDRPNALIQLVDINTAQVISSYLSKGKIGILNE